ncbi:hypothetical protein [Lacticaseibacillus porcinae]|uniref:hypothetical protein n=1 Tax=Lacticaseibacillus porcinae TaxID=1123687 RepID=UPI000F7A4A17|nr:hypothetical protein [Lacticaseibacillus porcinae]
MEMQSRRRIRVRGVVADSLTGDFLLPDSSVITIDAVVVGGTNFARVGKNESLDWPPQTVFAEYNQEFLRTQLHLGYGRPILFNGVLVKVHLIGSPRDRDFAMNLQFQQRKTLGHHLRHWLEHEHHIKVKAWPQILHRLLGNIDDYLEGKLTLEMVLTRFTKAFSALGPRLSQRTTIIVRNAWALSAKFDRSLDERLPPVYLFRDVQRVENFQFGDARDTAMKYDDNDYERRDEPGYLKQQFDQVQVTKQLFQQLDLPFYDPKWLATKRERNQPVWEPSQLKQYHL